MFDQLAPQQVGKQWKRFAWRKKTNGAKLAMLEQARAEALC